MKKYFGVFLGFFLTLNHAHSCHISNARKEELLEKGILKSPHIKAAFEEWQNVSKAEEKIMMHLRMACSKFLHTHEKKLRKNLKVRVEVYRNLDESLKKYTPGDLFGTTFQIKSNKMVEAATGALNLLKNKDFIDIIRAGGRLPKGYSYAAPKLNLQGAKNHIYGSGRGISLRYLLLEMFYLINEEKGSSWLGALNTLCKTLDFGKNLPEGHDAYEYAPFLHCVPLPTNLNLKSFQTPFIRSMKGQPYLMTIHNGYAYGGQRLEGRYGDMKEFGPQDCSSFIQRLYGVPSAFSTLHQYHAYCEPSFFTLRTCPPYGLETIKNWQSTVSDGRKASAVRSFLSNFQPTSPRKLEPGDLYTLRKLPREKITIGTGGHTGIVIGRQGQGPDAKVLIYDFNRNLPDLDGRYMISEKPLVTDWNQDPLPYTFYFHPTRNYGIFTS